MIRIIKAIPLIIIPSLMILEISIGLIQLLGLADNLHSYHRFTGTFYNPGPYACFLAIGVPIAVRWADTADNKLQKFSGMGMVVSVAILIPATLSRTACVACAIGCCVALTDRMSSKIKGWGKLRWAIVLGILTAIAISAYLIKKGSADGRLLMWKVATEAVSGTFVNGVGWDRVAGTYGEAQERYFASGAGAETEIIVADAPEYVFNEYLQVAIAYGIPIAIAMTVILFIGIIVALRSKSFGLAGSAVAVTMVMTASYPLQSPLFVAAIGLVFIGCYLSSDDRWINILGSAAVITACTLFLTHNSTVDVRSEFAIGHSLHKMREYHKSNGILLCLLPHSSDPMILNIIGKNYQSLGMPDSAEHYLMKSVNRCPNRLYPHYLLMNLYADSASYNQDKLLREAEILINKKEKIPSPAVDEMRAKAREILETLK